MSLSIYLFLSITKPYIIYWLIDLASSQYLSVSSTIPGSFRFSPIFNNACVLQKHMCCFLCFCLSISCKNEVTVVVDQHDTWGLVWWPRFLWAKCGANWENLSQRYNKEEMPYRRLETPCYVFNILK